MFRKIFAWSQLLDAHFIKEHKQGNYRRPFQLKTGQVDWSEIGKSPVWFFETDVSTQNQHELEWIIHLFRWTGSELDNFISNIILTTLFFRQNLLFGPHQIQALTNLRYNCIIMTFNKSPVLREFLSVYLLMTMASEEEFCSKSCQKHLDCRSLYHREYGLQTMRQVPEFWDQREGQQKV